MVEEMKVEAQERRREAGVPDYKNEPGGGKGEREEGGGGSVDIRGSQLGLSDKAIVVRRRHKVSTHLLLPLCTKTNI